MTRQDIITTLRHLPTGTLREVPSSWHVEGIDGRLVIEADGARFDVEVWPSADHRDPMDGILHDMGEEQRKTFFRELDEAADEAERDGPVPAEELRRSLDAAIERGTARWDARRRARPGRTL